PAARAGARNVDRRAGGAAEHRLGIRQEAASKRGEGGGTVVRHGAGHSANHALGQVSWTGNEEEVASVHFSSREEWAAQSWLLFACGTTASNGYAGVERTRGADVQSAPLVCGLFPPCRRRDSNP